MSIELSLEGVDEIGRFADMLKPWMKVRALQLSMNEIMGDGVERIEHGTRTPDGQRWDAWSTPYARTRTGANKLLYGEGAMASSFSVRMRGDKAEIVSDVVYAPIHQHGSRKRGMPARTYMGVGPFAERAIAGALERDLERSWSAAR